jgi:hypothetical protein
VGSVLSQTSTFHFGVHPRLVANAIAIPSITQLSMRPSFATKSSRLVAIIIMISVMATGAFAARGEPTFGTPCTISRNSNA